MKLHLGVHDVPYTGHEQKGATTTFEVAEILEAKYDVMGVFYQAKQQEIEKYIVDDLLGAIRSMTQGNPRAGRMFASGQVPMNKIDSLFRDFISQNEWQKLTGKEIKAASLGISHRFKTPGGKTMEGSAIAKGTKQQYSMERMKNKPGRPAFRDTGLYQASFRAWLEP